MTSLSLLAGRTVVSFLVVQSPCWAGGGVIRFAAMRLFVFYFLFFAMPCVGLQCVIVALPGHILTF